MSYRQSNNNSEGYQRAGGHRARYGEGGYQEDGRAWSLADFQRAASIEERNYVAAGERRRLVRQASHHRELD